MSKHEGKKRKSYSAEEKVLIIRRHLMDKIKISDLCDEYKIHPTLFYRWQKEFFDNGAYAFKVQKSSQEQNNSPYEKYCRYINLQNPDFLKLFQGQQ